MVDADGDGVHDDLDLAERCGRIGRLDEQRSQTTMETVAGTAMKTKTTTTMESAMPWTDVFRSRMDVKHAEDHDNDGCRDASEDDDDDNDGRLDVEDACPRGMTGWTSLRSLDWDLDGCNDRGGR